MSAIAGIYHLNEEPIHPENGRSLMDALLKYPADDIQTWHQDCIFFGCHAQWITPESVGERLPYYDSERRLAITADAIIDNRMELFDRLQVAQGERSTMPDSKLILLAYCQWGEDVPKYLIGDFAFMIWDERKRQLFGARDFSGSRTLYYYSKEQRFSFCTIIQPLFSLPNIVKKLNEQWMSEFLAIPGMFETVDPASTVYEGIVLLPPSHYITVKGDQIKLTRYCTIEGGEPPLKLKSNHEYEEAFRDVFQNSVTARLRTNRQVGAHLSGGLDSGSVVSFAAKALGKQNKRLHTFSYIPVNDFVDWTPRNRLADERPFIQSTVEHVGNIDDFYLDFQGKSPLTEIDDWLETQEMPYKFAENSFWLKGFYEFAHQHGIGVILNGQRGNWSVSWGPALDYQAMLLRKFNLIRFYRELNQYSKNIGVKKTRLLPVVGKMAYSAIYNAFRTKVPLDSLILINPEFAKKTDVFKKLQENDVDLMDPGIPNAYEARKLQFKQLVYWNINGTYGTKLSLRYRLWDRDPTNDLRVIRFCLSVPEEQYVQNGVDRSLIRRSTQNYLPDKVRLNQKFRGIQGADGIHRMLPQWKIFIDEVCQMSCDPAVTGYLNIPLIHSAIAKFSKDPRPRDIYDDAFKVLIRSLIFYRFIKKHA